MKTCPYCWEEIQTTAKKCRYCWEWLNDKKNDEVKENNKDNKSKGEKWKSKKAILSIIWVILAIVICYFILDLLNKKETWQGFYYPWELSEWTEISWPIFDNFQACQNWALNKYKNWNEAYCSKNCHDSIDWTPICEDVVRTWHPLPWFWTVFSWADEIREENERIEAELAEEAFARWEEDKQRTIESYNNCVKRADDSKKEILKWICEAQLNQCKKEIDEYNAGFSEWVDPVYLKNYWQCPECTTPVETIVMINNDYDKKVNECEKLYPINSYLY